MVEFSVIFFCSKTILCRYYSVFLEFVYYLRNFFDFLYFWSNNMENAPPPNYGECSTSRKYFFFIFRQIAPITQASFFNFWSCIIGYYICCCCVFGPLENVFIIGAIWPNISKIKLWGVKFWNIPSNALIIQPLFWLFLSCIIV